MALHVSKSNVLKSRLTFGTLASGKLDADGLALGTISGEIAKNEAVRLDILNINFLINTNEFVDHETDIIPQLNLWKGFSKVISRKDGGLLPS